MMPSPSSNQLAEAAALIRSGGVVGMPTETVYGLAANALDPVAVAKVFAIKQRPHFDPLIVHVADPSDAWTVAVPNQRARLLAEACWPGPLTLVLPKHPSVPDLVTSGMPTVAVRCPEHPVARALIRAAERPLAAPSANSFGRISPTTAAHVEDQLGDQVPLILDGGSCRVGVESTVVSCVDVPLILRPGGCSRTELEAVLGERLAAADTAARAQNLPAEAPGMLASHYAPRMPLRLRQPGEAWPNDPAIGLLVWSVTDCPAARGPIEILAPDADPVTGAANLFAALRRLEAAGVELIVAEEAPRHGLGEAINDRLRRAAGLG